MSPILGIWASQGRVQGDFESIATVTVGAGGSANITFSSIPNTYKHLQIRGIVRDSASLAANVLQIRVNSDTGTNYAFHDIEADGASTSAYGVASQDKIYGCIMPGNNATSGVFGGHIIDILDYASTNKNKTFRIMGAYDNNGSGQIRYGSGLWNSTSAITSITLFAQGGSNLAQYSTLALYGCK